MLLAGVGFMEDRRAAVFEAADPVEQAAVLVDMRAAWDRHGAKLLADYVAVHRLYLLLGGVILFVLKRRRQLVCGVIEAAAAVGAIIYVSTTN